MADNVTLPGTGALVATDEITRTAIVQHAQLFKLIFGGDGVYNGMLDIGQQAMAASIPVVLASNQSVIPVSQSGAWNIGSVTSITNPVAVTGTFWQATQPISGTVTANAGTNLNTSLLALETGGNLATIAGKDFATQTTLSALNTKVTACNTGAVVVASGTITTITNPVAVTGTFWQATQPVSGTVSATVSGTVTANLGTIAGVATETTLAALNTKVTACNTGAVTVSAALPAGTKIIGKVGIDQTTPSTTNAISFQKPTTSGLTEAKIDFAGTGDNTIVAAVNPQTTRCFKMFFVVSAATTVIIKDGATALTGAMTFNAGGTFTLDQDGDPWFTGTSNTAFIINQSGTAQISGRMYYKQS